MSCVSYIALLLCELSMESDDGLPAAHSCIALYEIHIMIRIHCVIVVGLTADERSGSVFVPV